MTYTYTTADLIGNKFNRLTVLTRSGSDSQRRPKFLCKCNCGNFTIVNSQSLRTGHTKSCGCIRRNRNKKALYEASFNKVYTRIKLGAIGRNYTFNISKEEFKELSKMECYYCGCKPYQKTNNMPNGDYIYNGLDRVDNEIGYELDNIVPCCGKCNRAKDTMNIEEFYKMIEKIYLKRVKE